MKWKQIEGFPGYEVSDDGQVRSYWKRVGGEIGWEIDTDPMRILAGAITKDHKAVLLMKDGHPHSIRMHRLVAQAFIGPVEGKIVLHRNGDKLDNTVANLCITDESEKLRFAIENRPDRYISEETVEALRIYRAAGHTVEETANRYDVSHVAVLYICKGTRRADVGGPLTQGEAHHGHILTWPDVDAIREAYVPGQITMQELADVYGVSVSTISRILSGELWKEEYRSKILKEAR
jgi:predicted DNA-binding protein (UPF0251 family)